MAEPVLTIRVDWGSDGAFTGAYDDVSSALLAGVSWTRGRSADFSAEATGSATFALANHDDRFTPDRNWHDNPSFEVDTAGWSVAAIASLTAAATSIGQVTDNATASTGSKAGEAVLTGTVNSGVTYPIPYTFRSGVTYAVSVYLKSMSGALTVRAGLASSGTPADIASSGADITAAWAAYTFTWTPSADRADGVFFVRTTAAAAATVRIDAAQVNPGAAANTFIEAPTKGQLIPGRPVHIYATHSATDYPAFFGYIERLAPDPRDPRSVTITCYDVLRRLSEVEVVVPANTFIERTGRDMRVEILSDFERGVLNLVGNPSFETDTTGWAVSSGTITRVTTDAASGTCCGEFAAPALNDALTYRCRLAPVFFANQLYRLSLVLWTTLEGRAFQTDSFQDDSFQTLTSGTSTWTIGLYTDAVTKIASKTITATTTKTRHTITFTVPATVTASQTGGDVQLTVLVKATGANIVRVDAVQVTRGMALYPYADVGTGRWPNWCGNASFDSGLMNGWYDGWTNLIGNPSIESDTTGWSAAGDAFVGSCDALVRDTGQYKFGTASLRISDGAPPGGPFYAITGTFKAGVAYKVSIWGKSSSGSYSTRVGIGSNGTPADTALSSAANLDTTGWKQITVNWTPSADRTDAHLYVTATFPTSPTYVYLDGASVVRIDPSAALGPVNYADTGPGGGGSFTSNRTFSAAQAKWGVQSQVFDTPATAGAGRIYDFSHLGSYFQSGRQYVASVWLYCSGSLPYKVGIGANAGDGTFDEASTTGTASAATWTQVTLTWTPSADRSGLNVMDTVLYVHQTDATARTIYIDGPRVTPGSAADAFEMAHWSLSATGEATDVYGSGANIAQGSALAALSSVNGYALSRHWIEATMATPWYAYNTSSRVDLLAKTSAETFNDDLVDMSAADIDRASIINIVPVSFTGSTEHYSDAESIERYGPRPTGDVGNSSFLPNRTIPDLIGPALVARYKDPRARPAITVIDRFPSQLQRELDDLVTVNCARLGVAGGKYLVVSLTTTVAAGGWSTVYRLEEAP